MTHILGLTGSIGTGKSTVCSIFRRLKVPVFEADKVVNSIYQEDISFLKAVETFYPHYFLQGTIDKRTLAHEAFHNPPLLQWLQEQLHPRVHQLSLTFIKTHQQFGTPLVIFDLPLLFEAGFETLCHNIMVTTCKESLQRKRVLERPFMTLEKYQAILKQQWPQHRKNAKATWLLCTNGSLLSVVQQLQNIKRQCIKRKSIP